MLQLRHAKSVTATSAPALPSSAVLSTRDAALIKGLARTFHDEIEVLRAEIAGLKAQIRELKTLTASSRPPESGERRGHGDARGPHSFEYPGNNWRQ
jgi:hypothetical protein